MFKAKRFSLLIIMCILTLFCSTYGVFANSNDNPNIKNEFTKSEIEFIEKTKYQPIKVGVIPNHYPMSLCPPESDSFKGITIDMFKLLTQKTGLEFEYYRIPIAELSPVQFLKTGEVDIVAGALRSQEYLNDKTLILSNRLFDGTAVFLGKKGSSVDKLNNEDTKVAITGGFIIGKHYIAQNFPKFTLVDYKSTSACIEALYKGDTDLAVVNKYVASYQLQKPIYENLAFLDTYSINADSCITALAPSSLLMSIINKGLSKITEAESGYILMNFTIANPYAMTFGDFIYKYRVALAVILVLVLLLIYVVFSLMSTLKLKGVLYYDKLTGAYTQYGFGAEVSKVLKNGKNNYFIADFDIVRFDAYNAAYGRENGDILIRTIAEKVKTAPIKDYILARVYADHFVLFFHAESLEYVIEILKQSGGVVKTEFQGVEAMLKFGIYEITDFSLPIDMMIDRAIVAKRSIKGNSDKYYAVYDKDLHDKQVEESNIISYMNTALRNEEFFVMYQPKFDTYTEKIVGSEALIRWRKQDGTMVMPGKFIEIFERNGQIIKLDFYMFDKVCAFQRKIIEEGITPIVISVNFSRVNLYEQNFVSNLISTIEKYGLSPALFEIELTESAMIDDKLYVSAIIKKLQKYGLSVAMDDFGIGYSSLNSLKDLNIDVLKLDREFLLYGDEDGRGKVIIKTLLSLTEKLNITSVAEGVETFEQLEFLRECGGCDIIQGYYFSKPIVGEQYFELLKASHEKNK